AHAAAPQDPAGAGARRRRGRSIGERCPRCGLAACGSRVVPYGSETRGARRWPMDLNTLWFILLGVLLAGYAILDGFDLGVGILQPIARSDEERRIFLNSIGPIWDG